MTQLISFDPGLTTGMCIVEDDELFQGQYTFRQIGDVLAEWNQDKNIRSDATLICESFTINNQTARNSQAPWSLEVIGLIRYFAMSNHLELVFQQPSAAKRLITDAVIKRAGLWVKGAPHAMDATRHMMLYDITSGKGLYKECLIQEEE